VASVGAATPLTLPRQYVKNIGRKLEVRNPGYANFEEVTEASEG